MQSGFRMQGEFKVQLLKSASLQVQRTLVILERAVQDGVCKTGMHLFLYSLLRILSLQHKRGNFILSGMPH